MWKSSTLGPPTGGLFFKTPRAARSTKSRCSSRAWPESRRLVGVALDPRLDHVLITLALGGGGEAVYESLSADTKGDLGNKFPRPPHYGGLDRLPRNRMALRRLG